MISASNYFVFSSLHQTEIYNLKEITHHGFFGRMGAWAREQSVNNRVIN